MRAAMVIAGRIDSGSPKGKKACGGRRSGGVAGSDALNAVTRCGRLAEDSDGDAVVTVRVSSTTHRMMSNALGYWLKSASRVERRSQLARRERWSKP